MQVSDRIGNRMKLHDLHVLMGVAQAGSMRKAAALLNTTQPAISRSIADLEHSTGVRLLDRTPQGVVPTAYGRALLDGGAAVFDDLRQAMKNIQFLADPTAGEVRIGTNPLLASTFGCAIVDRVSRRYPRIAYQFETTQTLEVLQRDLIDRNVDFLIARRFGPLMDERLDFEFFFNDSFVVATDPKNPWARRRKIALAELANEPWVLPPRDSLIGSVTNDAFRACGLDYPRATAVTAAPEVRLGLLATGRFLTVNTTATLHFSNWRLRIKVLPVEFPMTPVPVGIVTLKGRTLSPVAKLFLEHAREVAKPLAKQK